MRVTTFLLFVFAWICWFIVALGIYGSVWYYHVGPEILKVNSGAPYGSTCGTTGILLIILGIMVHVKAFGHYEEERRRLG
ncbi:MAG: hypothetical protein ACXABY_03325 [Candidatus Thorarchaeota archaeon]